MLPFRFHTPRSIAADAYDRAINFVGDLVAATPLTPDECYDKYGEPTYWQKLQDCIATFRSYWAEKLNRQIAYVVMKAKAFCAQKLKDVGGAAFDSCIKEQTMKLLGTNLNYEAKMWPVSYADILDMHLDVVDEKGKMEIATIFETEAEKTEKIDVLASNVGLAGLLAAIVGTMYGRWRLGRILFALGVLTMAMAYYKYMSIFMALGL